MIYLLVFLIIISAIFGVYVGRIQSTTLWAGKMIAPKGIDRDYSRGFQDAITPRYQNTFNIIFPLLMISILVTGFIIRWYIGIIGFISFTFLRVLVLRHTSNRAAPYLKWIMVDVINRVADYRKHGDDLRAQAAEEMYDSLEALYITIAESDFQLPPFDEIQKMPTGGY